MTAALVIVDIPNDYFPGGGHGDTGDPEFRLTPSGRTTPGG